MSVALKNPKEAIGHKIRWHSWDPSCYLVLEKIDGRELRGKFFNGRTMQHKTNFVLSKGIRTITTDYLEVSWWYLIEELITPDYYKLDDRLFEI